MWWRALSYVTTGEAVQRMASCLINQAVAAWVDRLRLEWPRPSARRGAVVRRARNHHGCRPGRP